MRQLDRKRPYGKTLGDPNVFFKQDGLDFDSQGNVIPGSQNSASAKIAEKIEKAASAALSESDVGGKSEQSFSELPLFELKKLVSEVYHRLDEEGIAYQEVAGGKGLKDRLIEFLQLHA